MDESILDLILTVLSNNGTNTVEATDEVMNSMNLKNISPFHSNEIAFLIKQGHINREVTPSYQDRLGAFHPAQYRLNLTPQGLKFISEGGFTEKSDYAKKTLAVATQSRNWAIAAFIIALIALSLQIYYESYNNPVDKKDTNPANISTIKDTISTRYTTVKNRRDSIKTQRTLSDSIIYEREKKQRTSNNKTISTLGSNKDLISVDKKIK